MIVGRIACAILALCAAWSHAASSPQADFDLGRKYRNGAGVQRDSGRAHALIGSAAQRGHAHAMFILSGMLAAGEGAPKDLQASRRWLEAAAELAHPVAMQQLAMNLREGAPGFERDETRAAQLMNEVAHAMKHTH